MTTVGGLICQRPAWHHALVGTQRKGREAFFELYCAITSPTPAMMVQLCVIRFNSTTRAVYPVLASTKNLLSNNLNTKEA